jgi:DNA-directed RNA polymerase specialized sigma subunit
MDNDDSPRAQVHDIREARPAAPDLVDRIFDYIASELPAVYGRVEPLKAAVRSEFAGERLYVTWRPVTERQRIVEEVLACFNGRNATEIARCLNIGRSTVYRIIKQAGRG